MGINIATESDYSKAIRDLFPKGEYWERQFADPESDVNLLCKAKARTIIHLRKRMNELLMESTYKTAVETIGDWERILLGYMNAQLPLEERRRILDSREAPSINRRIIAGIAQEYGLTLVDIVFPFKPSFFGFSEFGYSVFSRPAFYSVFYIVTMFQNEALNNEAKKRVAQLLINSSFGQACFGTGQFLGHFYFNKHYASRAFIGMEALNNFERDVSSKLLSSNITYFLYKI